MNYELVVMESNGINWKKPKINSLYTKVNGDSILKSLLIDRCEMYNSCLKKPLLSNNNYYVSDGDELYKVNMDLFNLISKFRYNSELLTNEELKLK
jgi:hypothetical protein